MHIGLVQDSPTCTDRYVVGLDKFIDNNRIRVVGRYLQDIPTLYIMYLYMYSKEEWGTFHFYI